MSHLKEDRPAQAGRRMETLVQLLRERAEQQPTATAYVFVGDEGGETSITYAQLRRRARAVAQLLAEREARGRAVVIAMPPGIDFIVAFYGAVLARSLAVPVALPRLAKRADAERQRLVGLLEACKPAAFLTTERLLPFFETASELSSLPLLPNLCAVDHLDPARADRFDDEAARGTDIAVLQFTSGSTSAPRGVLISHLNILENMRMIERSLGTDQTSILGGWLPHYHDMGLFGLIVHPLYLGVPSYLMSPVGFLRRPLSWLQLISRHRVTATAAPAFAYERCLERVTDIELEGLDLSCLRVAIDGAEPVRRSVHAAFAERFARTGFELSAFAPSYGLAEATLLVSGGPPSRAVRTRTLSMAALSRGRAQPPSVGERGLEVVSCGRPAEGLDVRIVHPQVRTPVGERRVGEIWVAGPSVGAGYLGGGVESRRAFRATVEGDGPYLRTGDLGFFDRGELFVTGRLKELLVIRGRNFYPQDLEATVADALSYPLVRVAVLEAPRADGVCVVVEGLSRADHRLAMEVAASALFEAHGVAVRELIVLPAGDLPRTTSGKKQRRALAELVERAPTAQRVATRGAR